MRHPPHRRRPRRPDRHRQNPPGQRARCHGPSGQKPIRHIQVQRVAKPLRGAPRRTLLGDLDFAFGSPVLSVLCGLILHISE